MVKELRETLRAMWVRLRRTENWIFGMSQMPLIIEEGTSGIWRYRKWSNGVAECWGEYFVSSNVSSGWGNLFSGGGIDLPDYPTDLFKTIPTIFHTAVGDSGYLSFLGTQDKGTAVKPPQLCLLRGSAAGSAQYYTINLYAVGKWKSSIVNTPQNLIDYLYDNHVWDYNYLSNLPKINGQTVSGSKTLVDYGFTGEIANDKIGYTTTAPTADNTDGLKIVVLEEEPETKYDGWLYIIVESEEE